MDRREFLKKSMLLTAGALIGGSLFSETSAAKGAKQNGIPRKKKSIGLQLYSIGGDMSADAAQALRQISEMGYSTAETASYGDGKFYGRTPAEFRKMAEDLGIAVTGAHIARELDKNDMQGCMDWWKQACDAQAAVGGKTIVMPYFPVGSTLADLQDYCDYFNRVGEIANAAGLRFGYHNHSHEFNKIEGQVIEDYMIENTDPRQGLLRTGRILGQQGRRQSVGLHPEIRRPLPATAHQGRGYHRSQRDDRFRVDLQGGLQAGTRRVLRRDRGQLASAHALRPQKRRIPQRIEVRQVET